MSIVSGVCGYGSGLCGAYDDVVDHKCEWQRQTVDGVDRPVCEVSKSTLSG
jgi:hypothetical protein